MSGAEKAEVLDKVASSGLPKRRVLGGLGVPQEHLLPVAEAVGIRVYGLPHPAQGGAGEEG